MHHVHGCNEDKGFLGARQFQILGQQNISMDLEDLFVATDF